MRKLIPRIAAAVFLIVAAAALWFGWLYTNSRKLIAVSDGFPRDYYLGSPSDAPFLYVVLGDSTAVGTGTESVDETMAYRIASKIAGERRYVHVINIAHVGDKFGDVCDNQLPRLANLRPDLITLNCGANDATHRTPLPIYQARLQQALRALTATNAPEILVASSPDLSYARAVPVALHGTYLNQTEAENAILRSQTANTRVTIVDLFRDGKLKPASLYASDNFHPDAQGYAVWAKLFIRALRIGPNK
jgi:acyl-CoA thioesterase-1